MNREIKFKAAYQLGTGTVIIENVVVYADGTLGCSLRDFEKALPDGHHIYGCFGIISIEHDYEVVGKIVDSKDEWVWFEGKPLQFTGLKDFFNREIYEGQEVINTNLGFRGIVTYEPQGARWIIKSERYLDLTEKTAMTGSKDGVKLDDVEILVFIDQDPSLISKH